MRTHPDGAGYDDDPRRRLGTAAGETRLDGLSSYLSRSAVAIGFAPKGRRSENVRDGLKRPLCVSFISCAATGNSARRWANWPDISPVWYESAPLGSTGRKGGGDLAVREVRRTRTERRRRRHRGTGGTETTGGAVAGRSWGMSHRVIGR